MEDYNWDGKKILVAEDEDMNFMLIEETLSQTGVSLFRASSGQEIIDLFHQNTDANLILMDVKMPGMTGYQAASIIRKESKIPIIAQTAYAFSGEDVLSKESGCNAYISKPIKLEKLMLMIDKFL